MSNSFLDPKVAVSNCLPTDRSATLKLPNGGAAAAAAGDAATASRHKAFKLNGSGHFSSSSTTLLLVFPLHPTLRQNIHGLQLQPILPFSVKNKRDDETINLDISTFVSPILMASSPSVAPAPSSSSEQQLSILSQSSFWNDAAALALVDVLHTLVSKSVPQNLVRRLLRRRRRRHQRMHEIDATASKSYKTARGIPNYGQTCFLNSILQSLASLEPFLLYLERLQNSAEEDSSSNMVHVLYRILQTINGQREGRVDPRSLLKEIGETHSQFRSTTREQQDAQELLQALMDMLIALSDVSSISLGDSVLSLSSFLAQVDQEGRAIAAAEIAKQEVITEDAINVENQDITTQDGEEKKEETIAASVSEKKKEATNTTLGRKEVNDLGLLIMGGESWDGDTVTGSMFESISSSTPSPLNGWIGSTLQCTQCHHVRPIQNAPFLDIGIVPTSVSKYHHEGCYSNQPSKNSPASRFPFCKLSECLENFTAIERVKDVECRHCTIKKQVEIWEDEVFMLQGAVSSLKARSKLEAGSGVQAECTAAEAHLNRLHGINPDEVDEIPAGPGLIDAIGQDTNIVPCRGDALKCLLLTRLPTIVCVHIQRRYYDRRLDQMAKTIQHVEFEEVMDFGKYSAYSGNDKGMTGKRDQPNAKATPVLYRLMSVVEHSGNAFSGHYVAYRRDLASPGKWIYVSDERVKSVSWQEVKARQAYMLFYEKMQC